MIGQKLKSGLAIIAAVLAGFLMLGLTYLIFPNIQNFKVIGETGTSQTPSPIPTPNSSTQIFSALLWIGLAVVIAMAVAGSLLVINRARSRKGTDSASKYFAQDS
ncbi:MAG: hypothetical protein ACLQO7_10395 [Candidatus Bathyarchaeia archaeon]|jgi:ABC-type antimicrobial peptide transport system permease subunit